MRLAVLQAGPGGVNMFAAMSAEQIFREFVRPIGIGAIAMAGIIGIIRSSGVIGSAFKLAVNGIFGGKDANATVVEERTQQDLKMSFIMMARSFSYCSCICILTIWCANHNVPSNGCFGYYRNYFILVYNSCC